MALMENLDQRYTPEDDASDSYLMRIKEGEADAYRMFQDTSRRIERVYASLKKLGGFRERRDLEIFWSTMQVMLPSIYATSPVPVVTPKFKGGGRIDNIASEFLERCCVSETQSSRLHEALLLVRDDLCLIGRGVMWVNFYDKTDGKKLSREQVCPEHVDRQDFVHEPARKWNEVGFCARRCWMTYKEMKSRFGKKWEDIGQSVFKVVLDLEREGGATSEPKCPVYEFWDKTNNRVVWVTEGVDKTLDECEPHLKLEGFFPCPKPAYGTLQPRTLIPVSDFLQYESQIEEINDLTDRIHKLSEAVKVKGFYQAGSEVGDAVETAMAIADNHNIMIPIRNISSLTMGSSGQPIVYWPVEVIVGVIRSLVELRAEIINNVYQVIGISDIMRGSTDSQETATAQQMKANFGSVRIRDKQSEMVRIARDTIAIMAEIMAEHFSQKTLVEMSRMDLPPRSEVKKNVTELENGLKAVLKNARSQIAKLEASGEAQFRSIVQQDPQHAQESAQAIQQQVMQASSQIQQSAQEEMIGIQEQLEKLANEVTIDDVMDLLRDNKLRPFILDIETDSTIAANEMEEKQQRGEFVAALSGLINNFGPILKESPALAPLAGGVIKFALAPFRVGRELEGIIDDAISSVLSQSSQPQQGETPEAAAARAESELKQQRLEMDKAESAKKIELYNADIMAKKAESDAKIQTIAALADQKAKLAQQKSFVEISNMNAAEMRANAAHQRDMESKGLDVAKKAIDTRSAENQAIQKSVSGAVDLSDQLAGSGTGTTY